MNCIISSETDDIDALKAKLNTVPSMEGLELSSSVTTKKPYFFGNENSKLKVAVLDFGVKTNILRSLASRDCYLQVFPMSTSFEEMKKWSPDGYMISNGPGDPSVMKNEVRTIKNIIDSNSPTFGICLGHQLIAEASGISTFKMHKGHRGINHPVKNLITGKCEVTSQNHGFSVNYDDVLKLDNVEITHSNLNDKTVEGLRYTDKNVFTVQHHPEASPGPNDSQYLFDDFINLIVKVNTKENKNLVSS
jgi:carbamoyl-phosphate synthase small subunit